MQKLTVTKKQDLPVLFAHFDLGEGNATVALAEDGSDLHYGVSLCSPVDRFSKAEGREKALQRLRVHLQRRANGLDASKQAGTFGQAAKLDANRLENRFDRCRLALAQEVRSSDRPAWVPLDPELISFRGRRKKVSQ